MRRLGYVRQQRQSSAASASPISMMACGGGGLRRRGDQGLTTLEWLLIVAAVAGLAVVSVVIVTRVVDQSAAQVASANPIVAAAQESARSVVEQARTVAIQDRDAAWATANETRCRRLSLSFGSAVEVWTDSGHTGNRINPIPAGLANTRAQWFGHALDHSRNLQDPSQPSKDWDHLVSWLDGGTTEPKAHIGGGSPRGSNQHSYFGCFIRQRPTN